MGELSLLYVGMERYRTIQKIAAVGLEGLTLSSFFRYAKIKGNVLFFVFKHPNALFEFAYKKEDIKTKMRGYYSTFKTELRAHNVVFNDIHACVIAEPKSTPEPKKTTLDFVERSRGNFENKATGSLAVLFEDIRKTIKEKA